MDMTCSNIEDADRIFRSDNNQADLIVRQIYNYLKNDGVWDIVYNLNSAFAALEYVRQHVDPKLDLVYGLSNHEEVVDLLEWEQTNLFECQISLMPRKTNKITGEEIKWGHKPIFPYHHFEATGRTPNEAIIACIKLYLDFGAGE